MTIWFEMMLASAKSASARAEAIGRDIAAVHADDVDRSARFPTEAMAAIKSQKLLGIMVPRDDGGEGTGVHETTAVCSALGRHCAATAMIFAMHQTQVQSLLLSARESKWQRSFIRKIAAEQLLLASATTEGVNGGDILSSSCAVETNHGRIRLHKRGTIISYGRQADAVLVTARRGPDAHPSDQVLVAALKGQFKLESSEHWDPLGMRGTCSEGFSISLEAPCEQVCPLPFAEIAAQAMLPTSHIFWSGVWHGIATDAVARAQAYVRIQARKKPSHLPVGALHLAEAVERLQLMRSGIIAAADLHLEALEDEGAASTTRFAITMNNLKVNSSQLLIEIVSRAMLVCGLAGYRNDSPYSVSRHLRDAHSAPLMINNDRIERNVAGLLLVSKLDGSLLN